MAMLRGCCMQHHSSATQGLAKDYMPRLTAKCLEHTPLVGPESSHRECSKNQRNRAHYSIHGMWGMWGRWPIAQPACTCYPQSSKLKTPKADSGGDDQNASAVSLAIGAQNGVRSSSPSNRGGCFRSWRTQHTLTHACTHIGANAVKTRTHRGAPWRGVRAGARP